MRVKETERIKLKVLLFIVGKGEESRETSFESRECAI